MISRINTLTQQNASTCGRESTLAEKCQWIFKRSN